MRHKWFMASCVVLMLTGLAHFAAANFAPQPEPKDPRGVEMLKLMKEYQIPELKRTMQEVSLGFSHFFEIATLTMGLAGLLVAREGARARPMAMMYAAALVAMLINSIVYWFFVPTSFLGASLLLCVISLVPSSAKAPAA